VYFQKFVNRKGCEGREGIANKALT
jgi:hypothetical protein